MVSSDLPIGDRIRHYRGDRRQDVVAGLAGIAPDYLSQIERGVRIPSLPILYAIAQELGVPIAALLAERPRAVATPEDTTDSAVARALMGFGPARSAAPVAAVQLRERVEAAWRIWQSAPRRFSDIAVVLPDLIADTEHAAKLHRTGSDAAARRETLRAAADLYGLLRSYLRRTGRVDLSLMAADRAMRAAEDADDPLRIAAAQWNVGHVLLATGDTDGAEDVAIRGVEMLTARTSDPTCAAMAGALHLVAATAAAKRRHWDMARKRVADHAAPAADLAGEGNVQWTVFGPTNVRLHLLSIEMEAGDPGEALRLADQVDTDQLPSRERAFTFSVEVANCYDLRREDAGVLLQLLGLESVAPEDLARSPLARNLVLKVIRRGRAMHARQAEALASRVGIL